MSEYTRWEQGRWISDPFTATMSARNRTQRTHYVERSIYVVLETQEVGRLQVALCANPNECAHIVATHNAMIDRIEHLEKLAAKFVWEESQPQEDDRSAWPEQVFCGKSIGGTAIYTCKRTPGHPGDCWASR